MIQALDLKIRNFENWPKILQKWALAIFKIKYFHFRGLNLNSGRSEVSI